MKQEYIEIYGAREHNLKNIDLKIPRNKLVVITGISGSGKSSLAFDTLYAEGQRRYMESFSAYARSFIGEMKRPDVDKIEGLSPVISIEQKTTSRNPRSTVGTITEIYDFLRLLFARAAKAYSYHTGKEMIKQSQEQMLDFILEHFQNKKISILAPLVKGRKGHYRELFVQIAKMGFSKLLINGKWEELQPKMQLDRYTTHNIDVVVDRLIVSKDDRFRLAQSLQTTINLSKGSVTIADEANQISHFSINLMCPDTGISYDDPAPNTFSFNSPYGYCEECHGLGTIGKIAEELIIPDKTKNIKQGGILPLGAEANTFVFKLIEAILKTFKLDLNVPIKDIPAEALEIILYAKKHQVSLSYEKLKIEPNIFIYDGVVTLLIAAKNSTIAKEQNEFEKYITTIVCPDCKGNRLKKESLQFKIADQNISQLAQLNILQLDDWFTKIENFLDEKQKIIAQEIVKEIKKRINFLKDVGLTYLSLDRPFKTLSGGESQRIRLATQIGTQLTGVLYIMDEPSIGLHQRDNQKLINALMSLRDLGNSILVVEHDKDMMLAADYIIDIGPKAGRNGGKVIAVGEPKDFIKLEGYTPAYLRGEHKSFKTNELRKGTGKSLELLGANGNNLKNVNLELPLGKLICVTGVSGSGKSSLIHETLVPILKTYCYHSKDKPLEYKEIKGLEFIDKIIEVDQSPIGRTPRSNPATYTGVFSDIRELFAQMPESKIRGYKTGRFSFNVKGGRCETCEGGGIKLVEMEFLPDVYVTCETCKGKRYNKETLEVRFKGKSVSDVLEMTITQAVDFFANQPKILNKIKTLNDVGLGYITLGQHATTLSGGEAQRTKLATELSKKDTGKTLYVLDEPTTGLHFQDIILLLEVLHKLADKGNTVLIIEHNLDVIKTADHIIDLGPEGGDAGGKILAIGSPREIANNDKSITGKFLKLEL